jgi:Domain of unknown function (DUF4145)
VPIRIPPPEVKVKCPHCHVVSKSAWEEIDLGRDPDGSWALRHTRCNDCDRLIIVLREYGEVRSSGALSLPPSVLKAERMVWPKPVARTPVPAQLPKPLADDYLEACKVLPDSAKASAALSRRCLQNLLVERAGVAKKDLVDQIQEVLDSKQLPTRLADDLHVVRVVGNFAAHPVKSKSTGEIVEVCGLRKF